MNESACVIIRKEGGAQLIKDTGCSHGAMCRMYENLANNLYNKSWKLSDESSALRSKSTDHYWKS